MGNRISVQFINDEDKSVVLFSHWGGISFYNGARDYVRKLKQVLKKRKNKGGYDPIGRLEPNTVMVDFVRELTKDMKLVESDLYFGKDEFNGDNSDNGHFQIDLNEEAKDVGYKA